MSTIKDWTLTQKRLDIMTDDLLKKAIISFIEHCCEGKTVAASNKTRYYYSKLPVLFKEYELQDLDWEDFQEIVMNNPSEVKAVSDFLIYLAENDYYKGLHKNKILDLKLLLCGEINKELSVTVFNKSECIDHFYTIPYGKSYKMIKIAINNIYLRNLLLDFLIHSGKGRVARDKDFFDLFEDSLDSQNIEKLKDFNYSIFKRQFDYFYNLHSNDLSTSNLVAFYLYLLHLPGGEIILNDNDPVDLYYLSRHQFISLYTSGYEIIRFNTKDPIPEIDNWVIYPEGFNNKGNTLISSDSVILNFSAIINEKHRYWAKHWIWKMTTNIANASNDIYIIKDFLNYLNKCSSENVVLFLTKANRNFDIMAEHIANYRNQIAYEPDTKVKAKTVQGNINILRNFLEYLDESKLATIDPICYKYCRTRGFITKNDSQPLEDNQVKELLVALSKRAATGKDVEYIYFVMAYLQIFTEMRLSQIRSIPISAIKTDLKNKHYIEMPVKQSSGELVRTQITVKTKKLLDDVISRTQELRDNCKDPATRELLFIELGNRKIIRNIPNGMYSSYLNKISNSLGFKCTSENLRDTYMTKAMEAEILGLLNDFDRGIITKHATTRTDDAHYAKARIKDIVQMVYNCIIGDIDVKGKVIKQVEETENIPENQVSHQCGLCSSKTCTLQNNLDCLMCHNFVTSKEFLAAFKDEIQRLDEMIINEMLRHEKEHLIQIKRLCMAYIAKIIEVSEVNINEQ